MVYVFRTVFILLYFFHETNGATSDNTKALLTDLFTTNSYNKNVRPSLDQSVPTLVYLDFTMVGFNGLDEVQQKLTITGYLSLFWFDEHLKWDPANYGGVDFLYLPQTEIWKPDIALQNGFQELEELGSKFVLLRIYQDGQVLWMPFEVFETRCDVDIAYFPFDKQTCLLNFVVWSYSIKDVNITTGTTGIYLTVTSNGKWDIILTSARTDLQGLEARVMFSLTFRRKPLYIILNIILPVILLSVLNVFVFMLPADSGEKMGYSITVFLSFAVFLTIVSESLPDSSDSIPLISLYLLLQLSVSTVTVMITSLQLRVNFRHEKLPVSSFSKCLVRCARVLQCRKSCLKRKYPSKIDPEETKKKEISETEEEITWKDVSSAIDFSMFWFFTLVLIVSTLCTILVAYTLGSSST